jgi:hypothetical protein
MYTLNRLEWHLDERRELINPAGYCVVLQNSKHSFDSRHSFAVALAKSQDHRASCGVFAFGQHNAARRWLCLRYPDTRASQIGERGLSPRARWLKQSGTVRCDGMAPKSNIEAQANFGFDHGKAVLCSNIHQRAVRNTNETVQMRWVDKGTSVNR